ncbi:MAG: IPT/TIG domain-containing protein [Pseudomonadota bacterium]
MIGTGMNRWLLWMAALTLLLGACTGDGGAISTPGIDTPAEDTTSEDLWIPPADTVQHDTTVEVVPEIKLKINSVAPITGPTAGGILATVKGTGFLAGARVYFGENEAASATVETPFLITCEIPAGAAGKVDVTVTLPDERSDTLEAAFTYAVEQGDPLTVSSILPESGPETGGFLCVLTGTGFDAGMSVRLGASLAEGVTVLSSTSAHFVAPPGTPGVVNVVVKLGDDQAVLPEGFEYTATEEKEPLKLSGITPASGPEDGGGLALISGAGFGEGIQIQFGTEVASLVDLPSSNSLTVTVPAGAAGKVDVVATLGEETSILYNAYTYLGDEEVVPLALTGIQPDSGPVEGGFLTVLEGAGFAGNLGVQVGAISVSFVNVLSPEVVTFLAPPNAVGTYDVSVTQGIQQATLPAALTYFSQETLTLSSIEPASGLVEGGTLCVVKGSGFDMDTVVWFGGLQAEVIEVPSSGFMAVLSPAADAPGPVTVTVTAAGGANAELVDGFLYTDLAVLGLAGVQPSMGLTDGGYLAMLSGTGFKPGLAVTICGVPGLNVQVLSPASTVFTLPAGVAGACDVTVMNPDATTATLAGGFIYVAETVTGDPPVLGLVTPKKGPVGGGTWVLLTGLNFVQGASVSFGQFQATAVSYVDGSRLLAETPPSAPGYTNVKVTNPDGASSTLSSAFQFQLPGLTPVALTALAPSSGPVTGGTIVILTGENFAPGALAYLGGAPVADLTWLSSALLTVITPPGDVGPADLVVVNPDGSTAVLSQAFSYFEPGAGGAPPPSVSGVFPAYGTAAGGMNVSVIGASFQAGAMVFFDGHPLEVTEAQGAGILKVVTPAHAAGSVDVAVVNPDGQTTILSNGYTYFVSPPFISALVPDAGPVAGGTPVIIAGAGFAAGAKVYWGGGLLGGVIVTPPDGIQITAPPHAAGAVDVTVVNADGLSVTAAGAYLYEEPVEVPPPEVYAINPIAGPAVGGYQAIVNGAGFQEDASVTFGTVASTSVDVLTPEVLVAQIPAGTPGTTVDLTVTNPDQQSVTLAAAFSYNELEKEPLAIASVMPPAGPLGGGISVAIVGAGFVGGGTSVSFGGTPSQTVTVVSGNLLTSLTPPGVLAGSVDVMVSSGGESATLTAGFLYQDEDPLVTPPQIQGIAPSAGPAAGGTTVQVVGVGFQDGAAVAFGGTEAAAVNFSSSTLLLVTAPAHAAGTISLVVENPDGGAAILPNAFTYYAEAGSNPPIPVSVIPGSGSALGNDLVTLNGVHFVSGMAIYFCGDPATQITVASGSQASCRTPPGTGVCDVEVVNPDGQAGVLGGGFSYQAPQPTLDNVVPGQGPVAGGIDVVIYGDNFMAGMEVWFGVSKSQHVVLFSSETASATVPAGLPGKVNVKVTNPGGPFDVLIAAFEYKINPQIVPPPLISQLVPGSGPLGGGTVVNIQGTDFQSGAQVLFSGVPAGEVTVLNGQSILAVTPPGDEGTADVTVLNPDGQGTTAFGGFEYVVPSAPPPKLFGVVPASGPQGGGTTILVTGKNLSPTGMLYVNFQPVTQFTFLNDAVISGVTPAGAPGAATVSFVGGDGQEASLQAGFTFIPAPQVESISPKIGPVGGGTVVTVVGKNFQPGAVTWFGDQPAETVVENSLILHATAPAVEAPELVDITVVNGDNQAGTMEAAYEYLLPPTISSISPGVGPVAGGTPVAIWGANLSGDAAVTFGGVDALGVQLVQEGLLLVTSPPGTGVVDVAVTNPDGQTATAVGAFEFIAPIVAAPVLLEIFPIAGPEFGGTLVSLTGQNLGTPEAVFLGTTPVTSFASVGASTLLFETPAHAPGTVDVTFVGVDGQSAVLEAAFQYIPAAELEPEPMVLSLSPLSGPTGGNTVVTITGEAFQETPQVYFGSTIASEVTFISTTKLEVITPALPASIVDVTVLNPDGQVDTLPDAFTFVPPPQILGISPAAGTSLGGTAVTINGSGFWTGATPSERSRVYLCLDFAAEEGCQQILAGQIVDLGVETIVFETPSHLPGFVDVGVINPDSQQDFLGGAYYFNKPPVLTGVSPDSGPTGGGTIVTVTGSGFMSGMKVFFGDAESPDVTPASAQQVLAVTPPGPHGMVDVSVENPDGTPDALGDIFQYIAPPNITAMYPTSGPEGGGTQVTLEGEYFVTGDDPTQVFIGNVPLDPEDVQVLDATLIIFITPPGTGPVAITVVNPDDQEDTASQSFVYVPPSPPPTINYLIPNYGTGSGGDIVSIIGTGFMEGAQVFFGAPGAWVAASNAQVKNLGTMITVTTPTHPVGTVDVRVLNSNQQEALAVDAFEFTAPQQLPPLAFTAANPNKVPLDGGVQITISGKGFKSGIQVYFGYEPVWIAGTQTQYLGPTILHTVVPESPLGDTGSVDIRLINPSAPEETDEIIAEDALSYVSGGVFELQGLRIPPDGRDDGFGAAADFNNDGLMDVLILRAQAEVFINTVPDAWGFGGWFQKSADLTTWNSGSWYHATGDFDGDGDLDVMERRSNNAVLERNNSDGTFAGYEDKGGINGESRYMTPADFNCDGYLDVFIASYSTASSRPNRILVGDGDGGFTHYTTPTLPAQYENTNMAAAADVDLDGDVDLILANDTAMQNRLYYNNCANIPYPPICHASLCQMEEYNGHAYAICTYGATWEDAKEDCESNGYTLVTVNDEGEQAFLLSKTNNSPHWIGMNDLNQEGVYQWLGDTSIFTKWGGGQPDNAGGDPGEDCVAFRWWSGGEWNDAPCTQSRRFICESDGQTNQCPAWEFTEAQYGPGNNFPISGFNTRWISMLDLDTNGYPDAVLANWGQNAKVYMNYGGNFETDDYAHWPQDEENPYIDELFPVDLDLDGDTDIIARVQDGSWWWFRTYINDLMEGGAGALELSTAAQPARTGDTRDFAVGDFDGDLLPDMWVVNDDHQDQLLINNGFPDNIHWDADDPRVGPGVFAFNSQWGLPEEISEVNEAVTGDIDGDGDPDIIKANWKWSQLRVLVNQGDGTLQDESAARMPPDFPGTTRIIYNGMKLDDMDGDGDLDLVTGGYRGCDTSESAEINRVRLFLNDGDGYFTDITEGNIPAYSDHSIKYIDTGDINGDGKKDIFAASCYHCYCYYLRYQVLINGGDPFNTGGIYFFDVTATWFPQQYDYPNAGSLVDLNLDGKLDLYLGRGATTAQNRLYFNSGSSFQEVTNTHLPSVADDTYKTWVDDFDGDGDLDLYSANWGQDRMYLQEVNHTFSDVTTSNVPTISNQTRDAVFGDFDGDGMPDIFVINDDQINEVYLNQGTGKMVAQPDNLPWDDDWGRCGVTADFDMDGDLDVFVGTTSMDRMYINVSN